MIPADKGEQKKVIREVLSQRYAPDDVLADKIAEAIRIIYADSPPEEWDEVAEAYRYAFGKRMRGDAEGEPPPPDAPFEALVTDGWFARYLEWTHEHESPAQYHYGATLAAIAAGMGRRPLIEWEARTLFPNLYALLIGPTGARKGAAIERAVRITGRALGTNVLPNEGTHQGFAAALVKRYKDTGTTADGLIVAPEFRVLVSREKHKGELFVWLTDWYDSPEVWERGLRGEQEYEIRNMCVSVLGGSNLAWLRMVPEDAITGGFFPRFVLFNATDKRFWKARPKFDTTLERELSHALALIAARVPERIGFTKEAGDYLDKWYEVDVRAEYERHSEDERFQAWLARKQAAAMKIACVWQIVDGERVDAIELEYLVRARRVVDWGDQSVGLIYRSLGVTREGEASRDVLEVITRAGGRVPQRALIRTLSNRYDWGKLKSALATLEGGGVVKCERSPTDGVVWKMAR